MVEYWNSGVSRPPGSRRPIGFVWRTCPLWRVASSRACPEPCERASGLGGGLPCLSEADWLCLYRRPEDRNVGMMGPGEGQRPQGRGTNPQPLRFAILVLLHVTSVSCLEPILPTRTAGRRKSEARNPKSETNSKHKAPMTETLSPRDGPFGVWPLPAQGVIPAKAGIDHSYYYLFQSCFLAKILEHTRRKSLKPRELGVSQRRQDRKG
jgi:hypothetical protein